MSLNSRIIHARASKPIEDDLVLPESRPASGEPPGLKSPAAAAASHLGRNLKLMMLFVIPLIVIGGLYFGDSRRYSAVQMHSKAPAAPDISVRGHENPLEQPAPKAMVPASAAPKKSDPFWTIIHNEADNTEAAAKRPASALSEQALPLPSVKLPDSVPSEEELLGEALRNEAAKSRAIKRAFTRY